MAIFELNNSAPLDESLPAAQAMLGKLQGNILKGHGREHGLYIFFTFGNDLAAVKKSLSTLTGKYVTSALTQDKEATEFRNFKVTGGLFGNLLLTASGYTKLKLDPVALFPEEDPGFGVQSTFAAGLKEHAVSDFNDPPTTDWEKGYQGTIDAMLLLADDDKFYLLREGRRVMSEIAADHKICAIETGDAIRNDDKEGIEHFGYVDGRSQPLYLKSDFKWDSAGKRIAEKDGGAIDVWDPFEPLSRVLRPDPAIDDDECHGSFMVFRKLEQDVRHFKLREQELADALAFEGEERELAGALAVGRFEDGTPVTLSRTDGFRPAKENNFTYEGDQAALKCPFHAHIRKSNPRGDIERLGAPAEAERKRRITRRGIPFGSRVPNARETLGDLPIKDVGLLFMCFQESIRTQFAFMQRAWCNDSNFIQDGVGLDSVIGQPDKSSGIHQSWPTHYGKSGTKAFRFENFVHMKGGEYFFAPSIPFLKGL